MQTYAGGKPDASPSEAPFQYGILSKRSGKLYCFTQQQFNLWWNAHVQSELHTGETVWINLLLMINELLQDTAQ